ncbi:hypothetical protein A2833_00380 [Candidatus Azambacteria bacterium RIFCSPHIGHO2_01_FULL_44_55]|uniref:Arginine--tRNA ligase n=2 Tax=Patescibacteria group TaxID=1783273 RepID=A0A1F5CAB4_9BACT|nr:MAG: hypothetical protein A3A18_02210 [Candidatus Azambacteria bacterium RIFCSPLOWO2_01_FULL_44_84]OGD32826.1 MAG: hypothetical protein A3C78_03440 [Candidatus Azambacteria bacterium RIFCSPHIGHO2_02_FULL_45_18]OGD39792.1 MAG: hypothetical protein A3I30_02205 [Candidatus Azambacteria bacterium RIFCSPLOWO2_02_FULL_44_14]OGD41628.1 MAG: hypothetical protein A2833_00380 [Candidatus Azambacteria bacterium RIFCSPHIGHO2_01_FULL_44_55]OGD52110.1 MAG: hypothetical protein A2608_00385 [Candidatus Azam
MKELIKTYLADIVRKMAPEFKGGILIETPENKEHGDYSSNIAFQLAKTLKRSSQDIAVELAKKLKEQKASDFSDIKAVGGFINFFLSPECLADQVKKILKTKNKYGFSKNGNGKKIQVEFISANPTGPMTLGNGRGGFLGDVLANIFASQGFKTEREYYINDRGEQVLVLGRSIKLAQGFKVEDQENIYKGDYVKDLAKKIGKNLSAEEAGRKAVEIVLKSYIKPVVEKKLKIKFNKWFSEKSLYPVISRARAGPVRDGDALRTLAVSNGAGAPRGPMGRATSNGVYPVRSPIPKGIGSRSARLTSNGVYETVWNLLREKDLVYEKDGATWMKTSKLGDTEDRVLIKKNGNETYFLSDILYHWNKFNVRGFDKVVDIWGADHHGYAPRLVGALTALGIDKERLDIIATQLIRLTKGGKEFKISKRTGAFVTIEELVDEVGADAARYFFLSLSPNTQLDFNIDLAKERSEKNPVYYVQYAHARLSSILRKVKSQKSKVKIISQNLKFTEKAELDLMRKLVEYPELLAGIAGSYEVHRLSRYALELARQVSAFYRDIPVLRAPAQKKAARLALVAAAKMVLAYSLNLMGIKAPERM